MTQYIRLTTLVVIGLAGSPHAQEISSVAEINVVDAEGRPTFVGLQSTERYTIEGTALNDAGVFNGVRDDGSLERSLILFVQDDTGGIQVYSGSWYGGGLENYPAVTQGERVQVTGLTGHFGGKTNINERHNPDQKFDITIHGAAEDPEPLVIEDLAASTRFDQTRRTGGEYHQGRLVKLHAVKIVEGAWENGSTLIVEDSSGGRIPVELRAATEIAGNPKPTEYPYNDGYSLDIIGVFNQEDEEPPYTEGYLVWPRSIEDFQPAFRGSHVSQWDVYE